jgi:hypothetical protein
LRISTFLSIFAFVSFAFMVHLLVSMLESHAYLKVALARGI